MMPIAWASDRIAWALTVPPFPSVNLQAARLIAHAAPRAVGARVWALRGEGEVDTAARAFAVCARLSFEDPTIAARCRALARVACRVYAAAMDRPVVNVDRALLDAVATAANTYGAPDDLRAGILEDA